MADYLVVEKFMRTFLIYCIRFYQAYLSKYLGGHCIYTPSCSNYAIDAISNFGSYHGGKMAIKRLFRCRPPFEGGYDPIVNHNCTKEA